MTPDDSQEVRVARLEVEVQNLKDGHRDLTADIKDLTGKVERLTDRLNGFMVKTAVATAGLTAGVQVTIDYVGA